MRLQARGIWVSGLLGLAACTLPNPPRQTFLPPSSERVRSNSTSFHVYRYKIPHGVPANVFPIEAFTPGIDDLLISVPGNSSVELFKNDGNGSFRFFKSFDTCAGGQVVDSENIIGDEHQDFAVNCLNEGALAIYESESRGNFVRRDFKVGQSPSLVFGAPHLKQAGSPYFGVVYETPPRLSFFYNHGGENFSVERELNLPASPAQVLADVFSPNQSIGFAVLGRHDSLLTVFSKWGGSFERRDYPTIESPSSIISFFPTNGKGVANLVLTSQNQSRFRIYANNGRGDFSKWKDFDLPLDSADTAAVGHLRGRVVQELVFQSNVTGDIAFYPDHGGVNLGSPEIIQVSRSLSGLTFGHFAHKSDGMDMAFIDSVNAELVIFLNEHLNY